MLENPDTLYSIILASFIMPVFLAVVLIWFFISYQKKKYQNETDKKDALLREQALLIEKQQAIENERIRIASEMHDDLGSGLTTIRYLSDKALKYTRDTEESAQIQRIADHSNRLVRNMSEIIWAMNSRFDNAGHLTGYLRRYASEFLEEHQVPFTFMADGDELEQISFSGERRRNIFLVFKELLHNTVKYAVATAVDIRIDTHDHFTLTIIERNARGFDPSQAIHNGNGLYNAQKRIDAIGGELQFQRIGTDMHITIRSSFNPLRHV